MYSKRLFIFQKDDFVPVTSLGFSFVLDFADTNTERTQSHGFNVLLHAVIDAVQRYSGIT